MPGFGDLFLPETEHIFVLYPARFGMNQGKEQMQAEEVQKGQNVRFYHLLGPQLYALKAGTDLTDPSVFKDPSVPRSSVEIRQVGPVSKSERARSIRRIYRITAISGTEIVLKREPDQRFDAAGKPLDQNSPAPPADPKADDEPVKAGVWALAGIIGLPILLGLLVTGIERRRKSATAAASQDCPPQP